MRKGPLPGQWVRYVWILAAVAGIASGLLNHQHELQQLLLGSNTSAEDRVATYTLWLALFTAALVIVSALQIGFLIRADYYTQRSLQLTRQEFAATHRPRVVVRVIQGPSERNRRLHAEVIVANIGESAAIITEWNFDLKYWPVGRAAPPIINAGSMQPFSLRSGQRHTFRVHSFEEFTDLDRFAEASGTKALYVLGLIRYRDVNGASRETAVCRVYDDKIHTFVSVPSHEYQD
jgi:hypothetical protein